MQHKRRTRYAAARLDSFYAAVVNWGNLRKQERHTQGYMGPVESDQRAVFPTTFWERIVPE